MKPFLICISILLMSLQANGQQTYTPKALPYEFTTFQKWSFLEDFYLGHRNLSELTTTWDGSEKFPWKVYSDRVRNEIYDTYEFKKTTVGRVDIMDELYVIDVHKDWAKVVTGQLVKNRIETNARSVVGWIQASNLVLSPYSVQTSNSIAEKALILLNLEDPTELERYMNEKKNTDTISDYNFFGSPGSAQNVYRNEQELEIRYVLKHVTVKTRVYKLLSLHDNLAKQTSSEVKADVSGWIFNKFLTPWQTRVCLEKAFDEKTTRAYLDPISGKPREIPVFLDRADLGKFNRVMNNSDARDQALIEDAYITYEIDGSRLNKMTMRLPVLPDKDSPGQDIKTVAAISKVLESSAKGSVNSSQLDANVAKVRQKFEVLRKEKRNNINLLFIIDATNSMERNFKSVQRGLDAMISIIKDKNMIARISIAVYRDTLDGKSAFQCFPLNGNIDMVRSYLDTLTAYSIAGKNSKYEAQYNGILKAIEKNTNSALKDNRLKKTHGNIAILIGDAGNYRKADKQREEVISKLLEYQFGLIAYQVTYGVDSSYLHFHTDVLNYLHALGKKNPFKGQLKPSIGNIEADLHYSELKFISPTDGLKKSVNQLGVYQFYYTNENDPMNEQRLMGGILDGVQKYVTALDSGITEDQGFIDNPELLESNDHFIMAKKQALIDDLRSSGLSETAISNWLESKQGFSVKGYTQMRFYNEEYDCFKPVVFLSQSEFEEIEDQLTDMHEELNSAEAHKKLYSALLAATKKAMGETSDKNIKTFTLNKIWGILFNIPFDQNKVLIDENNGESLADIQLQELLNCTHSECDCLLNNLLEARKKFSTEYLDKEYSFFFHEVKYYWIPLHLFPGNVITSCNRNKSR